jgi:hypothetical protein
MAVFWRTMRRQREALVQLYTDLPRWALRKHLFQSDLREEAWRWLTNDDSWQANQKMTRFLLHLSLHDAKPRILVEMWYTNTPSTRNDVVERIGGLFTHYWRSGGLNLSLISLAFLPVGKSTLPRHC